MLTVILCGLLLLWFAVFKFKRRRMYELAALVPSSKRELPFIGVAHIFLGSTADIMASLQQLSYESMETKGILTGWLGHILYFLMVDPVDLEYVMKTCLEKDDLHRFLRKVIGYGGIFAPVSIWRRRRKVLVPTFSPKILEGFVETFSAQTRILVDRLEACADSTPFNIWPYLTTYTLDSVCETAMGVEINAQSNENSPFVRSLNRVLNLACERIFHLWLQPDWMFKCFFHKYREHQKGIKMMHDFVDDVITRKRESIRAKQDSKPEVDQEYDLSIYQKKSFLDHLIKLSGNEKGFNNIELREEVLTLTIAGTDTSAVAIGYTLELLGKYPKIQDKVYDELYDIFGHSDRHIEKADLQKLVYLERVLKESMRLYPPVPFIIRKVLEETRLPSGYVLPVGSGVVISIWGIHRNYKLWGPDAEYFDPDRFSPERYNLPHPYSYMPFSGGPRNCVGYQYALMSMKMALASILRRFRVVGKPESGPIPKIDVKLDVMMKPVNGHNICLEKRKIL